MNINNDNNNSNNVNLGDKSNAKKENIRTSTLVYSSTYKQGVVERNSLVTLN